MRRFLPLVLLLSSLADAQTTGLPPREVTLRGYLVDAMCGRAMAGKAKGMQQAAAHTRGCALDAECAASGFGVFSPEGWFTFDTRGDSLAMAVLTASPRAKGNLCEVTGTPKGERLTMVRLREIDEAGRPVPPVAGGKGKAR